MKLSTTLSKASLTLAIVPALALSTGHAFAASPGQIEGGNGNYTISNVTKGSSFSNTQTADACDVLEYRLHLYNLGPSALSSVKAEATINAITPYTSFGSTATVFTSDGLTQQVNFQNNLNMSSSMTQKYVKNSTELLDSAGNVIKSSANGSLADTITMGGGGIELGSIGESIQEYVQFKTQLPCPTPPPPAPAPVYSCDMLNLAATEDKTVKLTAFSTTAKNGATFSNATIDWGDKSAALTTANLVGQTHTYSKFGTYTVVATANFSVNGSTKSVSSVSCQKQITFAPNTPPVVVPPTTPVTPASPTTPAAPTTLVNTGAGNVAGLFAAVTAAGAIAYRFMVSRRFSRQ